MNHFLNERKDIQGSKERKTGDLRVVMKRVVSRGPAKEGETVGARKKWGKKGGILQACERKHWSDREK